MSGSFNRFIFLAFLLAWVTTSAVAQDLNEVLSRHQDALGGAQAITRLNSLKAEGIVLIGNQQSPFTMWAAFPNRLRIESRIGDQILVQSYDGRNSPWEWFPDSIYSLPEDMQEAEALEFISDADFNGPLINHRGKGLTLVLEGLENHQGRDVFRISVTDGSARTSNILIDAETWLVVRVSSTRLAGSVEMELDTYYLDYRPVAGILLPFRYEVYRGSTLVRTVMIRSMEANSAIPSAVFVLPDGPDPVAARIEAERPGGSEGLLRP